MKESEIWIQWDTPIYVSAMISEINIFLFLCAFTKGQEK